MLLSPPPLGAAGQADMPLAAALYSPIADEARKHGIAP